MKIIAIGDQHFQVSNIQEVNIFIKNLLVLINDIKPDIIVCLGDLLHTHERLHTIALNIALDFLDKLRKIAKTFVLVGNHDYINNTQFLTNNHWLNPIKEWENIEIVDNVKSFSNLCFVPYVYPGKFKEALNNFEYKNYDIIFAHQEFYGCKMGAINSIEGDIWDIENPLVISGHIHSKQLLQKNIYYTGACMQHAFGESDINIIAYIELGKDYNLVQEDSENKPREWNIIDKLYFGENITLYEIDINLPRKKIVYMGIDEIENLNTDKITKNPEDKIKLTISGNYEEFKSLKKSKKYKELTDKGLNIVFKPKNIEIKRQNENINQLKEIYKCETDSEFKKILYELINKEKNPYLIKIYEKIINDKDIDIKNIMFL
jgi:DNA repair exonuclease SbcCD nuclease subunit